MAVDPNKVERYTGVLDIPIYQYGSTRWNEPLNDMADRVDLEAGKVRARLDSLELTADGIVELRNEISSQVVQADQARAAAVSAQQTAASEAGKAYDEYIKARNERLAAASSADSANISLLALGEVLSNGIGAFSFNEDGELIVSYNDSTLNSIAINSDGEVIVDYND